MIWNSSYDALYWWIVHVSFLFTWNQWMTVTRWLSFLCWNPMYESFVLSSSIWIHCPMVMCIVSTVCIMLKYWFLYPALLNLYLRYPSLERKVSFFLKWFLLLPLGFTFYNLATFWVITHTFNAQHLLHFNDQDDYYVSLVYKKLINFSKLCIP